MKEYLKQVKMDFLLSSLCCILLGVILVVFGVWFLLNPAFLLSIFPIVIGIVLLFHGIRAAQSALESKKYGNPRWGLNLILAIVSVVLGLICAFDAIGVLEDAVIIFGLVLIYNGVSNIWIALSGNYSRKNTEKLMGMM